MDGLSRTEIDRRENAVLRPGRSLRPRHAATLIVLDDARRTPRVLMGRRSQRHVFMPGKLVFPGGRTDPGDSRVPVGADLHPEEAARLQAATRCSAARARAIALSALREAYEEAGLMFGEPKAYATGSAGWRPFAERGLAPSLSGFRLLARAITPPGRVRRFDTWFFVARRSEIAIELPEGGPSSELEAVTWLSLDEAIVADVPDITRSILKDLKHRLTEDPGFSAGRPVPFYRMVGAWHRRDMI
jgi:8-oxo-dGTP pyrophosphatase MutT (NUDIX family)